MPSDEEIRQILSGAGTSNWFKNALNSALDRDPMDAVNDAELLALVLGFRADRINREVQAELVARDAIKRAQNNGG